MRGSPHTLCPERTRVRSKVLGSRVYPEGPGSRVLGSKGLRVLGSWGLRVLGCKVQAVGGYRRGCGALSRDASCELTQRLRMSLRLRWRWRERCRDKREKFRDSEERRSEERQC
eukprot:541281-Rhodomonas_salina.1